MSEETDDSQKTEEPSQKRLDDAREKGQIVTSKEVNNFFMLFTLAMIVIVILPSMMRDFMRILTPFVQMADQFPEGEGAFDTIASNVVQEIGIILAVPMLLLMIAALAAGFMQSRFNFSSESIKPKLEKISIVKGLGRMFSMRSVMELVKGVIKITVVGLVATYAIMPQMEKLRLLPNEEMPAIIAFLAEMAKRMIIGMVSIVFLIAIFDYLYQRREFMKKMRMSKQELKDEYKQQEGDPHIKQKIKALRRERAKKRMMAAVPKADVIITNPTHYAVALQYNPDNMEAPIVLAKGTDKVAQRIRKVAQEHKITIMRNPPLARSLYDNVEIDDPIPYKYYQAVAEIIGYVYKLKGKVMKDKKAAGGAKQQ